jgi:hypothetical protein
VISLAFAINIDNEKVDSLLDHDIEELRDQRFLAVKAKAEGGCVTVYSEC